MKTRRSFVKTLLGSCAAAAGIKAAPAPVTRYGAVCINNVWYCYASKLPGPSEILL